MYAIAQSMPSMPRTRPHHRHFATASPWTNDSRPPSPCVCLCSQRKGAFLRRVRLRSADRSMADSNRSLTDRVCLFALVFRSNGLDKAVEDCKCDSTTARTASPHTPRPHPHPNTRPAHNSWSIPACFAGTA